MAGQYPGLRPGRIASARRRQRGTYSEFLKEAAGAAPEVAGAAGEMQQAIEAEAPPSLDTGIPETVKRGLELGMQGGYTQAERAAGKGRVSRGFKAATGGLAAGTAGRRFYAPHSVAQAKMGGPARELAVGLGELESREATATRKARQQATQTAAGLYQYPWQERKAAQEAMGARFAGLYGMRGLFPDVQRGRNVIYAG